MNRIVDDKLLLIQEVYTIIGVAIEVHRILGRGFLEAVYQEALGVEFAKRNIPHVAQQTLTIEYKGTVLRSVYVADFVCYDQVIVELKALDQLTNKEESQILNYLKSANLRVGVLINFGKPGKLEWKRFVM